MRKILYIVFFLSYYCFYSCSNEEKDLFDQSAAERLAATLKQYRSILTEAENGWAMEYYAGEEPSKNGGYIFLCEFGNDGEVTVASELDIDEHNAGDKVTSLYKLIENQGIVLTFDTYNDLIHHFSFASENQPSGMKGDYEFIIKEASPQKIIMQGKKRKNIITMTPVPKSLTWDEYLNKVINIAKINFYPVYKMFVKGKEVDVNITVSYETRLFTFDCSVPISQNVVYTPDGFKFYSAVTVNGISFQNFEWDQSAKLFRCVDEGVDIVLEGNYTSNYLRYNEIPGTYLFEYKDRYNTEVIKTATISEYISNKSYLVSGSGDFDFVFDYDRAIGGLSMRSQHLRSVYYMYMWIGGVNVNMGEDIYYRGFPNKGLSEIKIEFAGQGSPLPIGFIVVEKDDGDKYYFYDDSHCFSYLVMTRQ